MTGSGLAGAVTIVIDGHRSVGDGTLICKLIGIPGLPSVITTKGSSDNVLQSASHKFSTVQHSVFMGIAQFGGVNCK